MVTHVCRREFCGRTQIWCWDCSGYASANVCTRMRVCFPKGVISPLISPGPPSLVCRGQWPGWTAVMQFVSGWEFSASFKYWGKKKERFCIKTSKSNRAFVQHFISHDHMLLRGLIKLLIQQGDPQRPLFFHCFTTLNVFVRNGSVSLKVFSPLNI